MTLNPTVDSRSRSPLTPVQWLICIIAAIGFAFDIYELLMAQFIVRPALMELGKLQPGTDAFANWAGALLYVPAACGGIFGLLGGYLTDRLGRRRVLTWSILLYALSAFTSGFSTSLMMLLVLRCTTFIGVCVEFVAAVAWLAELFTEPGRREKVLGITQAFSSGGGFLAAAANGLAVKYAADLPAVGMASAAMQDPHGPWRYTLMSGLIPAIPLILIRPFLPESPVWREKQAAGTLRRPNLGELFSPALLRTTVVTTIMMACCYAVAFGAIQQMPQIVPGVPEFPAKVAEELKKMPPAKMATTKPAGAVMSMTTTKPMSEVAAAVAATTVPTDLAVSGAPSARPATAPSAKPAGPSAPDPKKAAAGRTAQALGAEVGKTQEIGGLVGRIAFAILAVYVVSRRRLIQLFQLPSLIILPLVFGWAAMKGLGLLEVGIFIVGFLTVAQFSFWGNYLPRVYPIHLRGTGESFAANIGGRLIGTAAFFLTQKLAVAFGPASPTPAQAAHAIAYAGAGIALAATVVGVIASFFLPEPTKDFEE